MIDWTEWYEGMPLPNPDALVEVEYRDSAVRESKLATDVDWRAQGATAVTRYRIRMPGALSRADERQEAGDHYRTMAVQPWAAMQAWMTPEQFRGFLLGSAVAYLARFNADAPGKGGKQDVAKARHYLDKLIEVLE